MLLQGLGHTLTTNTEIQGRCMHISIARQAFGWKNFLLTKGEKIRWGESSILLLQTLLAPGHLKKSGCHLWGVVP